MSADLETCCDAVASLYLIDRKRCMPLFSQDDRAIVEELVMRQRVLEHTKEQNRNNPEAKSVIDSVLWGKAAQKQVFIGPLVYLAGVFENLAVALGESPQGKGWWLLDPSIGLYIFGDLEALAKFVQHRLIEAGGYSQESPVVVLEIASTS